jgi:hypothetical protein
MFIQNVFDDRNSSMLVMCDHTFSLFSGIAKTIHMGDRMTNHIMRGLSNKKIWLIAIIDHKKRVYGKENLW